MDLTRFDFHALRFTKSDNVQSMTDAEIGQYIMLLCEAWLKAKDASLQNDPTYLARIAHCAEVSPKVMAQFHIVDTDWGERLRNDTLFEEWNKACARAGKKRGAAAEKWGSDPDNRAKRSERLTAAREKGRHTNGEWLVLRTVCGNECVRCEAVGPLVKDHIKPIYQGGSDGIENIQPLCVRCNSSKGPDNTDYRPKNWLEMTAALAGNPQAFDASTADVKRLPKPNQAVPNQAVPDQTEPEAEDVSIKKRINESAGRQIVDQRNGAEFDLLARRYGKEALVSDFTSWYSGLPDDTLQYPGSAYLKIADSRLQSDAQSAIIKSNPNINEIIAAVYLIVQRPPRAGDVVKLLADHSMVEIMDAFRAYAEPLDDFERKFATKNFFQDGAGVGIILARRQKKAADAALEANTKAAIETGVEARRAEADARKKKIDDEEKLAEQLGDNPF